VQTTLLGIAIAVILALVAALVGPLLVDWNRFRPAIEAEASRLIGAPVRVTGPIEAAMLPTPSLTLRGLEIGPADGEEQIRARALSVEFYLGSLLRGQKRARELHLAGLDLHLGITSSGQPALPKLAAGFDPDSLSIERLNIENGHAILTDARSGSRLVLDKLWFNGDVRSLAGPFKGDGAFVIAGQLYGYRIAAGRADDDGAIKLRLNIDPLDRPLGIDADGILSFERGAPRFEGSLNLARPAGIARPNGQTVANEPWRLASRVKATVASALLEEIEFQYGPDERAVKLTGTAELKFGSKPRFDSVLSASQIDLDRAFATPDATRLSPFAAVRTLGDSLSGALGPSIPARLGVSVDILTLAGATVHTLRGDLTTNGEAWNLDGFEFRAPGFTQVKLSGRLDMAGKRLAFIGPVSVDSTDPSALVAWLEGATYPSTSRIKPLSARGEVTFGAEKVAIDRLKAEIDRKAVEGRLAYVWAAGDHPARLDADLSAAELDIDALVALAAATKGAATFETPRDVTLGIAIDRALVAGIEARQVSARLHRDAKGLEVERFSVADFGGAAFDASGQIDTHLPSPRGTMNFHLDARELTGVVALLEKFAPGAADPVRRMAKRWPATRLDATLKLEEAGPATIAKLAVEGRSGDIRLSMLGEASRNSADLAAGDLWALTASDVRLQGKFDADEGSAIVDLLNLGKVIAADAGRPGQLTVTANGPLGGDLQMDGRLLTGGLNAAAKGVLHLGADEPKADLRLTVAAADALPLRRARTGAGDALPVTLIGNLTVTGRSLTLGDFTGTFAGSSLRGNLGFAFDEPMHIEGRIEAGSIDVPAAIAAAIGISAAPDVRADIWAWSPEPFARSLFEDVDGRIEFKVTQANFAPRFVLRQAQGVAKFSRYAIAFTDVEGSMADGRATGQLIFNKNDEGLSASGRLRLTNADAAALLAGDSQPPIAGRLAMQIDVEGAGLSPLALIGSLSGNGTVSLAQAQLAGLDAKAFGAATQAVDQGMPPETAKIGNIVGAALESGRLAVSSAEGVVTVTAGQVRLTNTVTQAQGADLTVAGTVDLIEGNLSARLALTGMPSAAVGRPVVLVALKGPISAPKRSVDVSALTTWLTLRAVEQQAKRLEAIEAKNGLPMAEPPAKDARTSPSLTAPAGEQAPPLPAPIEIPTIPGVSDQKPAYFPAEPQNGAAVRPSPVQPALPAASRSPPPDLSASRNN